MASHTTESKSIKGRTTEYGAKEEKEKEREREREREKRDRER